MTTAHTPSTGRLTAAEIGLATVVVWSPLFWPPRVAGAAAPLPVDCSRRLRRMSSGVIPPREVNAFKASSRPNICLLQVKVAYHAANQPDKPSAGHALCAQLAATGANDGLTDGTLNVSASRARSLDPSFALTGLPIKFC